MERQRHERLEFLYEATRTLSRSPEMVLALEGLLERSLESFRAEMAEIVLFGSEGNPPLRTTLGPGDYKEVMEPMDPAVAAELRALVDADRPALHIARPFGSERLRRYLDGRLVTDAMVAVLPGEDRVIGTIMLANRYGVIRSFTDEDLKLFETLANNASVALQYDRLEQAVHQLRALQEQLHHQAFHDPLTDLANRSLFANQVKAALGAGGRRGRRAVHRPRRLQDVQRLLRPRGRRRAAGRGRAAAARVGAPRRRDRAARRRRVRRDGQRRALRQRQRHDGRRAHHEGVRAAGERRRGDHLRPPLDRDRDHRTTATTRTS